MLTQWKWSIFALQADLCQVRSDAKHVQTKVRHLCGSRCLTMRIPANRPGVCLRWPAVFVHGCRPFSFQPYPCSSPLNPHSPTSKCMFLNKPAAKPYSPTKSCLEQSIQTNSVLCQDALNKIQIRDIIWSGTSLWSEIGSRLLAGPDSAAIPEPLKNHTRRASTRIKFTTFPQHWQFLMVGEDRMVARFTK